MGIVAISPNRVVPYSLITDNGDPKTIFNLGILDSLTRAHLDDQHLEFRKKDTTDPKLEDVAIHDKYVWFVRFGLRGWENFKDDNGVDIPFETEEISIPRLGKRMVVKEDCMKRLELVHIIELGIQILNNNHAQEVEKKSS